MPDTHSAPYSPEICRFGRIGGASFPLAHYFLEFSPNPPNLDGQAEKRFSCRRVSDSFARSLVQWPPFSAVLGDGALVCGAAAGGRKMGCLGAPNRLRHRRKWREKSTRCANYDIMHHLIFSYAECHQAVAQWQSNRFRTGRSRVRIPPAFGGNGQNVGRKLYSARNCPFFLSFPSPIREYIPVSSAYFTRRPNPDGQAASSDNPTKWTPGMSGGMPPVFQRQMRRR